MIDERKQKKNWEAYKNLFSMKLQSQHKISLRPFKISKREMMELKEPEVMFLRSFMAFNDCQQT